MAKSTNLTAFDEESYGTLCKQLDKSVDALTREFKKTCFEYRKANKGLASHRMRNASLEVINAGKADFTLLDAQEEFAWLIHEIQTGPVLYAKDHIAKANELIRSLQSD